MPTLAELAGVKIPKDVKLDGVSLIELINNKNAEWPERSLFTHNYTGNKLQPVPGAIRNSKYRFVIEKKGSELYDMIADPDETKNIAAAEPELTKDFEQQYAAWFKDVKKNGIHKEVTKVGYIASPRTELFTPDVTNKQGVIYKYENGYAHDWLTGWNNANDMTEWTIEIVNNGEFQIDLKYNCTASFLGQNIIVSINNQKLSKIIDKSYTGKLLPSPDRVQRIEAFEKDWDVFKMGNVNLAKGTYKLSVRSVGKDVPGKLELKSLLIHKL